eukprot:560429_1
MYLPFGDVNVNSISDSVLIHCKFNHNALSRSCMDANTNTVKLQKDSNYSGGGVQMTRKPMDVSRGPMTSDLFQDGIDEEAEASYVVDDGSWVMVDELDDEVREWYGGHHYWNRSDPSLLESIIQNRSTIADIIRNATDEMPEGMHK